MIIEVRQQIGIYRDPFEKIVFCRKVASVQTNFSHRTAIYTTCKTECIPTKLLHQTVPFNSLYVLSAALDDFKENSTHTHSFPKTTVSSPPYAMSVTLRVIRHPPVQQYRTFSDTRHNPLVVMMETVFTGTAVPTMIQPVKATREVLETILQARRPQSACRCHGPL